jgi:hypothetical protein
MSKYARFDRKKPPPERPWKVHPIWRGIGCLLLLVFPPIAYAGGNILVEMNMQYGWIPVSAEILQTITVPFLGWVVDHLYANLMAAVVVFVIGLAFLMFLYTLIYAIIGPSRFSPVDALPERRRFKKRK